MTHNIIMGTIKWLNFWQPIRGRCYISWVKPFLTILIMQKKSLKNMHQGKTQAGSARKRSCKGVHKHEGSQQLDTKVVILTGSTQTGDKLMEVAIKTGACLL